ncbi:50S ribosomal protein L11 methyltransferase [Nitrosomonas aestuarii]|uniref:50S ribosomal protein L11 methyltransferase n=1 Tax=Nitrosomonas aestuarii TaxID=52441 RepID=UPI000D315634|nr:50S ribosomal protein L11 methyltransferase [Nitrosomonas aestuarii]PTN12457.1 [LSU ribosomal protein L11P]-lysine N-methyltransferase [Nitrosomonas aestuarii]
MSWNKIIIKTDNASADRLSEALLEHGALSVDIHDAEAGTDAEQPLYGEPGLPAEQVWQKAEVTGLFDKDTDLDAIMQSVKEAAQLSQMPSYRTEIVEAQDWVRLTQAQFEPIQISARLWIVPTWHQPPDPAAINLILDPGLAFGTGSHPTTQLCLVWLDQHLKREETLLDYGCGSGILAIAALKLGAGHVTGIDIDPHAVKASQANALLNDCDQSKLFFSTHYQPGSNPDDKTVVAGQVDVVIANILSNPLIMLAPILAQAARRGGQIVLSGILQAQADEVKASYQNWFDMQLSEAQDGWVLLTGIKK